MSCCLSSYSDHRRLCPDWCFWSHDTLTVIVGAALTCCCHAVLPTVLPHAVCDPRLSNVLDWHAGSRRKNRHADQTVYRMQEGSGLTPHILFITQDTTCDMCGASGSHNDGYGHALYSSCHEYKWGMEE